ncbi:MAG: V-type ATPase subunit [Oscillospiraceae bacterium]
MEELYIYQVARVRSRELNLLSRQDIDGLMAAKSFDECFRILVDSGWGTGSEKTAEELFAAENQKIWDFMGELIHDLSPFDVLLYPTDYNNLKATIKCAATGTVPHHVFKRGGTLDSEMMTAAVQNNDFSTLPKEMGEAAQKAYRCLLQTRDGQLCDMILDKACLEAIGKAGKASKDQLVRDYAELSIAIADIKIAVRCEKTKKTLSFITEALAKCDSLNLSSLALAATKSLDDVFAYLSNTNYAQAAEKLKESASAFEKWCDDRMMDLIKKQKSNPFTIGPLMAYVLARQNEINTVRILLSGKLNGLDSSIIRERLRDMYV